MFGSWYTLWAGVVLFGGSYLNTANINFQISWRMKNSYNNLENVINKGYLDVIYMEGTVLKRPIIIVEAEVPMLWATYYDLSRWWGWW